MQLVLGVNATKSGFAMLPLMLGLMASAMISGRLMRRTGSYKPIMVIGCTTLFVGVLLLMQIGPDTTIRQLDWRMLLVGLGLGPVQSLYSVAAQNAAPITQMGIATSSSQFFRQIGSTVGIAIFGTMLTHNLVLELPKALPEMANLFGGKIDIGHMQAQAMNPANLRISVAAGMKATGMATDDAAVEARTRHIERGIKVGFSNSIVSMLSGALWIVGLGFLITLFIPALPLRDKAPTATAPSQGVKASQ
jgi:hypothetical protein